MSILVLAEVQSLMEVFDDDDDSILSQSQFTGAADVYIGFTLSMFKTKEFRPTQSVGPFDYTSDVSLEKTRVFQHRKPIDEIFNVDRRHTTFPVWIGSKWKLVERDFCSLKICDRILHGSRSTCEPRKPINRRKKNDEKCRKSKNNFAWKKCNQFDDWV